MAIVTPITMASKAKGRTKVRVSRTTKSNSSSRRNNRRKKQRLNTITIFVISLFLTQRKDK
jgi:hypothetical protein